MSRLLDANIAAPSWAAGTAPPPAVLAIKVRAGALLESPGEDHFPVDVEGQPDVEIALPPHCELVEVPQVSIRVSLVRCAPVFDKPPATGG